jgi:lipopolysaccharide/colanic/teichoic acid biosynthesis glycosyltransferase
MTTVVRALASRSPNLRIMIIIITTIIIIVIAVVVIVIIVIITTRPRGPTPRFTIAREATRHRHLTLEAVTIRHHPSRHTASYPPQQSLT